MTASNFQPLVEQLLGIEGGVSDRPAKDDPGKLTNLGVTQKVYDQWRALKGLPPKSVREITRQEMTAIAKANYWQPIQGDKLPSGIDFAVFDFAYNSGPAQAIKELQRALGVNADGSIGLQTLEALAVCDQVAVINGVCDRRLTFMKGLKNWRANKNGWTSRVAHVRAQSLALAAGDKASEPDAELTAMPLAKAPPAAPVPAKKSATVWSMIVGFFTTAWLWINSVVSDLPHTIRTILDQVSPFAAKSELAQSAVNILGAVAVAAIAFGTVQVIRKKKDA